MIANYVTGISLLLLHRSDLILAITFLVQMDWQFESTAECLACDELQIELSRSCFE
jgi:hypothetical protein